MLRLLEKISPRMWDLSLLLIFFWNKNIYILKILFIFQNFCKNIHILTWFMLNHVDFMLKSCWNHVEIMLESYWKPVGIMLKSCWNRAEIMLKSCWNHVEIMLKSCWQATLLHWFPLEGLRRCTFVTCGTSGTPGHPKHAHVYIYMWLGQWAPRKCPRWNVFGSR